MSSKSAPIVIDDSDASPPPSPKPKRSKARTVVVVDSDDDKEAPKVKVQKKVPKTKQDAINAAVSSFATQVEKIHKNLGTTPARLDSNFHFKPISKINTELQGKAYTAYPRYGKHHATAVVANGENSDKRTMQGSSWENNSCAIDTFLWVLTVLNIRCTRNDVIALPKALANIDEISRVVNEYLCLPLGRLRQAELNGLRDVIYKLVSEDVNKEMNFDPSAGMDIDNLFNFALSSGVPLHQIGFSQVRARACSNCPAYGISRHTDIRLLGTHEDPDSTPSQILQAWFGDRNIADKKTPVKCVSCGETTLERRVIIDRLPNILLWNQGCNRSGDAVKEFSNLVEFDVQVAEEDVLAAAPGQEEVTVWRPKEVRARYKPVVLVIRDTNYKGGGAHYYAGSCLGTEDGWMVYDGMKKHLVRPLKGFINQTASDAGREVKVVALQKVSADKAV